MRLPISLWCYTFCAFIVSISSAVATESQQDIETITVTARATQNRALQMTSTLDSEKLELLTPATFADVLRNIPGVGVRTNSRGETILRIRGSDERQTQVFLDGAPFTIPWDSRLDLNMLPASLIRHVSVIKSAAPIEYGANAVLGVVDISTDVSASEREVRSRLELGSQNKRLIEGELYQPGDSFDLQLGASIQSVDGQPIASKAPIPFETGRHTRSNTDQAQQSYFGAASWSEEDVSLRLSSVLVDSKKGIASQGHLAPDSEQLRFWRYPDWQLQQQNLNGQIELWQDTQLRFTTWYQQFSQTIESYDSPFYEHIEQRQYDDDKSHGGRLTLEHDFGSVSGRLAGNYSKSKHCQTEIADLLFSGVPHECFAQVLASVGGELDWQFIDGHKLSVASAYDYSDTPQTGGRPAQPAITKWAGSMIYQFNLSDSYALTASAGQRTRFPSMRELYGTSLGKFVVNPDLRPETSRLYDVSLASRPHQGAISWSITPWYGQVANTLAMKNVTINGKSLRQRYNLRGSTAYGIESSLTARLLTQLHLSTHLFWQHQRAETELTLNSTRLMQRPSSQVSVTADYLLANDWRMTAEVERSGTAFDEDVDATVVELPSAVRVNIKAFVPLPVSGEYGRWQLYVAFNNITNEVVLPQLGLPEPGRMFAVGLRFD